MSSGPPLCEHGLRPGECACHEFREISTIQDVKEVYNSGKATWTEWAKCANIALNHGETERAVDCIVLATTQLRNPTTYEKDFLGLVSQYLEARATQVGAKATESNYWLLRLANKVKDDLKDRFGSKRNIFERYLEPEIAQMLLLAATHDKYSQTKLAAKLRFQRPFEKQIRWGRPKVAKEILDELILKNPSDTFALVCRSATHIDLGNITDGIADANKALQLQPENVPARTALASAYLHSGYAWQAVEEIKIICKKIRPNIALVSMIYIACGYLTGAEAFKARELAEKLMATIDPNWDVNRAQSAVEISAIKILCSQKSFLQALQLLAELDREGWPGNTLFWKNEIYKLASMDPNTGKLPDFEKLKSSPQDFYPNHKPRPVNRHDPALDAFKKEF